MNGPRVSHYSFLTFACDRPARLVFPGRRAMPLQGGEVASAGYVRSEARARLSRRAHEGGWRAGDALPFRDYPDSVLVDIRRPRGEWRTESRLVFGCRNVLNEWGYQARIDGRWWRRCGDPPVPSDWPALTVEKTRLGIVPLAVAGHEADVVTGLPLVRQGLASSRSFLVAHCSDVAHSYEVHPEGLIGPSPQAWRDLANAWQQLRDQGLPEEEVAGRLEELAVRHGAGPSRNVLHSVLGQRADGGLLAVAVVGPLDGIARLLQREWQVRDAIVLDNGGSVGWLYFGKKGEPARLLVAGPNHRQPGTVFLSVELDAFPRPSAHPSVAD